MPQNQLVAATLAAAMIAAPVALPTAVSAGSPSTRAPHAERKPPGKVTFHPSPSEESPAQRERRLKRECKGRSNAGACLGFTTP